MADDDGSDHDDGLQYVKKGFLQPILGVIDNAANSAAADAAGAGDVSFLNVGNSGRSWYHRHADAEYSDSESNFFMSEPSISEADSTENPMRLLDSPVQGGDILDDDDLLFLDGDGDDGDYNQNLGIPPPPPPPPPLPPPLQTRGRLMAPHSPGNTSLSSWDTSPHLTRQVHVHFSPPRTGDGESTGGAPSSNTHATKLPTTAAHIDEPAGVKTPDRFRAVTPNNQSQQQDNNYPSNSTSPASEGRMRQLEAFLDDLRFNSEGQVQESSILDASASFEASLLQGLTGVQEVLRQSENGEAKNGKVEMDEEQKHHSRLSSVDTAVAENISRQSSLDPSVALTAQSLDDNTLAMILSDSADDYETKESAANAATSTDDGKETELSFLDDLKGPRLGPRLSPTHEAQQQSADAEPQLQEPPMQSSKPKEKRGFLQRAGFLRRKGRKNKNTASNNDTGVEGESSSEKQTNASPKAKPKHRRQRSGDAAAATIATGSHQWKGMALDRIPMPEEGGDETDTTNDTRKKNANGRRNGVGNKPPSGKVKGTIDRREEYGQRKIRQGMPSSSDSGGVSLSKNNTSTSKGDKISPASSKNSQASEIAKFSQFALGSGGDDEPMSPRQRPRRIKQQSYRTLRRAAIRGDSYSDFFQPHTQNKSQPQLQQAAGIYTSPLLSGHTASPTSRKTFSPQVAEQWQQGSPKNHARSPAPPIVNLSSSWTSPSPLYQNLPPYVPTYGHYRSYSEMPNAVSPVGHFPPPPPPPPLQNYEDPQTLNFNGKSRFQMPDKSAPMFTSDNQLLHHSNPNAPPRHAHSFDYSPSSRSHDAVSPFAQSRYNPKNDDSRLNEEDSYTDSDQTGDDSLEFERNINRLHEAHYEERVLRQSVNTIASPFSISQRKGPTKFDKRRFLPRTRMVGDDPDDDAYPTYICPVCNTRQREFFTVSSAPRQFEGPGGFIALYFAIYVIGSLYIFGLQEGWTKLDCIYFAVITLTTAGLGDFVPTSDGAKIICSIFIYFGVACIGLLLGSYIAGMLDERSHKEAVANQIKACPNCARIQNMKDQAENRRQAIPRHLADMHAVSMHVNANDVPIGRATKKMRHSVNPMFATERVSPSRSTAMSTPQSTSGKKPDLQPFESPSVQRPLEEYPSTQNELLISPMTTEILGRQNHTRHSSMDFGGDISNYPGMNIPYNSSAKSQHARNFSMDVPATVEEGVQARDGVPARPPYQFSEDNHTSDRSMETPFTGSGSDTSSDESFSDSSYSGSKESVKDAVEEEYSGVKNAKYIFLTLREALINSMVIIAFGCLGFCLIEGFSVIDSWYFTTVLLTTVGYGDITPVTEGGKLFATVYLLVAGTILLNNMSMISMIPLELRKRRTEKAVLTQFGDSLDDEALRELATGPVIQRINLASKDSRGLDLCTREMFALAMLIRLGKVTEQDIKMTFSAFSKLDVNNDGVLNSKSIIEGMIKRHASHVNLASLANSTSQGRKKSRNRPKNQSTRTAASTSSWSSLRAWIGPRTCESALTTSGDKSYPTASGRNPETVPLMFVSERTPMYGNSVTVPTGE